MADETNTSASEQTTQQRYQTAEIITSDLSTQMFDDGSTLQTFDDGSTLAIGNNGRVSASVPYGAMPKQPGPPSVIFKDVNGTKLGKDMRVKIRVPANYLVGKAARLKQLNGVIFPYTPSVGYEYKADYTSSNPLHSNFTVNFYQRSSISAIAISGKFTVETPKDAELYIATLHLLRSLTKMRSGGAKGGDPDSGAPPPVCRLDAYGEDMLTNVPVAITSVRVELPDAVDYYTHQDAEGGMNAVPVISTIAINCLPMFSRREMQQFNVTGYLSNSQFRKQGYM
jgi:hypothetical protein